MFRLVPAPLFVGALSEHPRPRAQILGLPVDVTASFRGGAQFGPDAIRTYSESIETYSPHAHRDIADLPLVDRGNVWVEEPLALFPRDLPALRAFLVEEKAKAPFTLFLAGEHTCTLAFLSEAEWHDPNVYLLVLDAHLDLRPAYQGSAYSHAAWASRALEVLGPERLRIAGARAGTREEFALAERHGLLLPRPEDTTAWLKTLPETARLHLSLDIDVLDISLVPGTGNPEPLGWQVADILAVLKALSGRKVVSADLVEYQPNLDPTGRTGILAAFLVREMLAFLAP